MKIKANTIWILAFSFFLFSCKRTEKINERPVMVVDVTKVLAVPDGSYKEYPFISRPFRSSELSFRVSGPLDNFEVYAGNYYRQGDAIASIDSRDFRICRERAEAVYNQIKAEFERIQVLFNKGNISASAYEKAKSEYITAKTSFETAANELKDTRLIAPFDGFAGEIYVENYQEVKASQPILSFTDISKLKIEVYVPQHIALSMKRSDEISLYFDALPDTMFKTQVMDISRTTTQNNLSYLLTALLPNDKNELLAGMSGRICLDISSATGPVEVSIPQTALCHRPTKGNYVWIVNTETGKTEQRNVQTGDLLPDGYVVVKGGICEGEYVATSGLRFLSDGMTVKTSEKGSR
ncbi:efflux RND transporter periplasmic adaptor subunit [Parabacteroides sp. APC149_11_2_Y6]